MNGSLVVLSLLAALVAAEIILRLVPIPGVGFRSFYWDDVTGGRYFPNSVYTYRNQRGDFVRRHVNSWGYLDKDHDFEKAPGTVRIGFFGDSFTQAAQVPLDETFFRRIEEALNEKRAPRRGRETRYESLAFGVSGYSTVQSYLESSRWMERAGLDYVVYVFYGNDLGDQMPAVKRSDEVPYPRLSGDTIVVDDSFRKRYAYKASPLHRSWQYVKSHSLVLDTAISRLKLLRKHGVRTTAASEDQPAEAGANKTGIPGVGWAPSAWPDTLRLEATTLGRRVLAKWSEEVRRRGGVFIVLYIPWEREMSKPYAEQDSWASWLSGVCAEENIPFLDPSSRLVERLSRGEEVFFDHLATNGHAAVSDAFVEFFEGLER